MNEHEDYVVLATEMKMKMKYCIVCWLIKYLICDLGT